MNVMNLNYCNMKRIFLSAAVLIVSSFCLSAQTGKVMDNLSIKSKILNMERKSPTNSEFATMAIHGPTGKQPSL